MTKVDQNGTTHTYSFDLLGRMTADAVTLASGNPQNVDSSVLRIENSYNSQRLVEKITSFDATSSGNITNQVQNVYSGLGQLTSQFQEHAGAVNTSTSLHVDYGYSDLAHGSRLVSMTYPNGRVLTYNYGTSASLDDTLSRLTSITDGNTTLESYAYLGLGTVVERDHPESGANLTYIKLSGESDGDAGDPYTGLDRFSRVVDQRWFDGSGTALDRYGYTYNRNSNRLTKSNSLNGNLSESYSYDDLNRLANMTRGGTSYQGWDLDALGNMNSVTTGNVTETRTHNAQNQLTSMGNATLGFDNNGNTITDDQGHTLVYDAWNRLIAVKSGATLLKSYSYDGQGWRISEAPAGGTATDLYYSSQWQVLEERQAGNATGQNVWGITYVDQLVLRDRDADQDVSHTLEERLYVLQDANENVTAIITTSGTVAERYVLDPYGVVSVRNADWSVRGDGTIGASTFGWVYLHQGGRFDVVAGEYSFRHRDYSPTMMRWMQEDLLKYVDGMSLFFYEMAGPTGNTDATGTQNGAVPQPYDPATDPLNPGVNIKVAQKALPVNGKLGKSLGRGGVKFVTEWIPQNKTKSGWIVQHFRRKVELYAGPQVPVEQYSADYWEAWQVVKGVVYKGYANTNNLKDKIGSEDTFQITDLPPGTAGRVRMAGRAWFIDDPDMKMVRWRIYDNLNFGSFLPTSFSSPAFWKTHYDQDGTDHVVVTKWNDCPNWLDSEKRIIAKFTTVVETQIPQ